MIHIGGHSIANSHSITLGGQQGIQVKTGGSNAPLDVHFPNLINKYDHTSPSVVLSAGRWNDEGEEFGENEAVIDSNSVNVGPKAYDVLNGMTNDISDSYWSKHDLISLGANVLQAEVQFASLYRYLSTTEGSLYTLSFYAYVETNGNLENYRIRTNNSESGDAFPLTLTEIRKRYSITVLGKVGGGSVGFGFRDFNTSNWSKVYIDTINVTQSSYALPPVINNTTGPVTTSDNYATADEGIKYPITGDLLDALDGKADGVEEAPDLATCPLDNVTTGVAPASGSILTRDTNNHIVLTSDADGSYILKKVSCSIGDRFEVIVTNIEYSTNRLPFHFWQSDWTGGTPYICTGDTTTFRTPAATGTEINLAVLQLSDDSATATLTDLSIKKISPAEGKMTVEWIPMISQSQYSGTKGDNKRIITFGNSNMTGISQKPSENKIYLYDESYLKTLTIGSWTAGTKYTIISQWGKHPDYADAPKMQLTVTDGTTVWQSDVTDFDGSFDPAENLSLGWNNTYWQKLSKLVIEKLPRWT